MIIIAGPGQGSQTPGFLSPWLHVPGTRELLGELSDHAKLDLIALGTTADADTIRDTAVAQPLIVAAGIVTAHALYGSLTPESAAFAGHSVGEITAAALAGILTANDAMDFVQTRSTAMARAAALEPTGMSAVLTRDVDAAVTAISEAGLSPANYNGAGQLVAAGAQDALAKLAETPPPGCKVIPLKVAGAFHTAYMAGAKADLAARAATLEPTNPIRPIYTNSTGERVESGEEYLQLLIEQVSSPVRWDLCQESFARDGATGFIELAPAGTLTGIARRTLPGVELVAVKTPDDLEAARALLGA